MKHIPRANVDSSTVKSFGEEWARFDQGSLSEQESRKIFDEYFAVFPQRQLHQEATGFDMGCGTGRWAKWVAPQVGKLHCVDPSGAISIAALTLSEFDNVVFHQASVDDVALPESSQDFGYSIGVLHHVPDTQAGIRCCVELLKPGAPLLLYLYYAFDNRPWWFRLIWKASDIVRRSVCAMPNRLKNFICDVLALLVYWPLARLSKVLEWIGLPVSGVPLSYYRNHSFYTMRTDARDRFGTPLEQRFTRKQIESMMQTAGLERIHFSDSAPFWCAVGFRKS